MLLVAMLWCRRINWLRMILFGWNRVLGRAAQCEADAQNEDLHWQVSDPALLSLVYSVSFTFFKQCVGRRSIYLDVRV